MRWIEADITSIKSISQRTLALHWARAAAGRPFPKFEEFCPPSRGHDPKYLVFWQVEGPVGNRDFRTMYQGKFIADAFHEKWEGRHMKDLIPGKLLAPALAGANACVDQGTAIYMVYTTEDASGNRLDCERLLLPFGDPNTGVRQFMASMEPISTKGDASLATALEYFVRDFQITLALQIKAVYPANTILQRQESAQKSHSECPTLAKVRSSA